METYSINIGTKSESTSYNLSDDTQFNGLLDRIKDNEIGEINPVDVRDVILSLFSNCIFKETKIGSLYYIGIDVSNPVYRDLKRKIIFGKRENTISEIFNDDLSNSNTDIFLYDTKNTNAQETKISILAGTEMDLFLKAPYISSTFISDLNQLSLNFINKSGQIFIKSHNYSVSINEIELPTVLDMENVNIGGKTLVYNNGKAVFEDLTIDIGSDVGLYGSDLTIQGEAYLNGSSLEFSDDRMVSIDIGSIKQGESFNSSSISDLLKRIVYSYQGPTGNLLFLPPHENGFIEVGTSPNVSIKYTINKKSLPTLTTLLQNMSPNTYPIINNSLYQTITGTASAMISPSPAIYGTQSYVIKTDDGLEMNTNSISLKVIYPFFYGVGTNNSLVYSGMNFLHKIVEDYSNKRVRLLGSGNIYFIYPKEYGPLLKIVNENFDDIIIDFTIIDFNFSSPEGNWAFKPYYIYKSNSTYTFNSLTLYSFDF